MRNVILFIVLQLYQIINVKSQTNYTELFSFDKTNVTAELSNLTSIETSFLNTNDREYFSKIIMENPIGATLLHDSITKVYGCDPFWYGCLFNIAGVACVYVETKNGKKVRYAFTGCVLNSLTLLLIYGCYYVITHEGLPSFNSGGGM